MKYVEAMVLWERLKAWTGLVTPLHQCAHEIDAQECDLCKPDAWRTWRPHQKLSLIQIADMSAAQTSHTSAPIRGHLTRDSLGPVLEDRDG